MNQFDNYFVNNLWGYVVKQAVITIRNEHRSVAVILHAMHHLVQRIRSGSGHPNFGAFRAMLYYLDTFCERSHHPKEDEFLFQPLRERTGEADAVIVDLENEHADGAAAIRTLEQALLRYEAGGEFGAQAISLGGAAHCTRKSSRPPALAVFFHVSNAPWRFAPQGAFT